MEHTCEYLQEDSWHESPRLKRLQILNERDGRCVGLGPGLDGPLGRRDLGMRIVAAAVASGVRHPSGRSCPSWIRVYIKASLYAKTDWKVELKQASARYA